MKIIIVEDEKMIRTGMAKLIATHTKHEVVATASNGKEGLELARLLRPELIITDIRMPVMDGLEMIEKINEMKLKVHIVILSGYSEFDYARKAIRYGVEEYLLKPLAAEDIRNAIEKVEEKIRLQEEEQKEDPEQQVLTFLYSDTRCRVNLFERQAEQYILFLGYTGETGVEEEEKILEKLQEIKDNGYGKDMIIFQNSSAKNIGVLLASDEIRKEEFEKEFQKKIVTPGMVYHRRCIFIRYEAKQLEDLQNKAIELFEVIKQGIGLRQEGLLTPELVEQYPYKRMLEPAELFSQMRLSVCREEYERVNSIGREFVKYMQQEGIREEDIRQTYAKLMYLQSDTIKEIDENTYQKYKQAKVISRCNSAITLREIEDAFLAGNEILINPEKKKEDISNYTIKKAINYIRLHYQEGITLEEVARALDITPEYLSTLFNREMKINFSIFLRQFRLSHAKRLLKGSEKKVYEIASEVGYADAKYFARVFKEEYGMSPGDYRQIK